MNMLKNNLIKSLARMVLFFLSFAVIWAALVGIFLPQAASAVTLSVQDAGAGAGCQNVWPVSIVETTSKMAPGTAIHAMTVLGWYIYRVNIWGWDNWVVSNTLGSGDYNNSTMLYQVSSSATPPLNSATPIPTRPAAIIVSSGSATPPSTPTIYNFNAGIPPYISGTRPLFTGRL
jgi:hypothetical protein